MANQQEIRKKRMEEIVHTYVSVRIRWSTRMTQTHGRTIFRNSNGVVIQIKEIVFSSWLLQVGTLEHCMICALHETAHALTCEGHTPYFYKVLKTLLSKNGISVPSETTLCYAPFSLKSEIEKLKYTEQEVI